MRTKSFLSLTLLALSFVIFVPISAADSNEAYQLYEQVLTGQKQLDSLSIAQQRDVIEIYVASSRNSCEGCSDDCRDAKEQAESYRYDLESDTKKLLRCFEGNDLSDDCYAEFRRIKSNHSDFESAVSEVSSHCD